MKRKIEIRFVVPQHRLMRCVYKIRFGRLFYIGKALILAQRMKQHERTINGILRNYSLIRNLSYRDDTYSKQWRTYHKIAKYLMDNPKIKHGTVEVLQRCVTPHDLYTAEKSILRTLKYNQDCFNNIFDNPRPREQYSEWDVKRIGNEFYYFDRSEPNKLFPHQYNVSADGEISVPRR